MGLAEGTLSCPIKGDLAQKVLIIVSLPAIFKPFFHSAILGLRDF